jgi:hypothetical protein
MHEWMRLFAGLVQSVPELKNRSNVTGLGKHKSRRGNDCIMKMQCGPMVSIVCSEGLGFRPARIEKR